MNSNVLIAELKEKFTMCGRHFRAIIPAVGSLLRVAILVHREDVVSLVLNHPKYYAG